MGCASSRNDMTPVESTLHNGEQTLIYQGHLLADVFKIHIEYSENGYVTPDKLMKIAKILKLGLYFESDCWATTRSGWSARCRKRTAMAYRGCTSLKKTASARIAWWSPSRPACAFIAGNAGAWRSKCICAAARATPALRSAAITPSTR